MARAGMSIAAFAREVGVTHRAVTQRIEKGRMAGAVLPDGSLDPEKAREAWINHTDPTKRNGPPPRAYQDAQEALAGGEYHVKLSKARIELETAEINLAKLKESTIDKADAARAVRSLMRGFRDHMLNFANRHGAAIAAKAGVKPGELTALIEERVRVALAEFADAPNPFGDVAGDE